MSSKIVLYDGFFSLKDTDKGKKVLSPVALLTDDEVFVYAHDSKNDFIIQPSYTKRRSILASIRGVLFAQELKYLSEKYLYSCFCAGLNNPNSEEKVSARLILNHVDVAKRYEIEKFVPTNIEHILDVLSGNNVLFDGEEIRTEINLGKIKNSNSLENSLKKNNQLNEYVDKEEFGNLMDPGRMIVKLYAHAMRRDIFMPFLNEYLTLAEQENMKALFVHGANYSKYCIFSKLKGNVAVDIDFTLSYENSFFGSIDKIDCGSVISPKINLRMSYEDVDVQIYDQTFLEANLGLGKTFNLYDKLPILFKDVDAEIAIFNDEISSRIYNSDIEHVAKPICERVLNRKKFLDKYDFLSN